MKWNIEVHGFGWRIPGTGRIFKIGSSIVRLISASVVSRDVSPIFSKSIVSEPTDAIGMSEIIWDRGYNVSVINPISSSNTKPNRIAVNHWIQAELRRFRNPPTIGPTSKPVSSAKTHSPTFCPRSCSKNISFTTAKPTVAAGLTPNPWKNLAAIYPP